MARTALTVQEISLAGITPSYAAAEADGNSFANDGDVLLQVKNAGSEITVTIQTPMKVGGVDVAEVTVTIPATTGDKMVGPFDPTIFNQSAGVVYVDYSAVTTVTVAAIKLD